MPVCPLIMFCVCLIGSPLLQCVHTDQNRSAPGAAHKISHIKNRMVLYICKLQSNIVRLSRKNGVIHSNVCNIRHGTSRTVNREYRVWWTIELSCQCSKFWSIRIVCVSKTCYYLFEFDFDFFFPNQYYFYLQFIVWNHHICYEYIEMSPRSSIPTIAMSSWSLWLHIELDRICTV